MSDFKLLTALDDDNTEGNKVLDIVGMETPAYFPSRAEAVVELQKAEAIPYPFETTGTANYWKWIDTRSPEYPVYFALYRLGEHSSIWAVKDNTTENGGGW